MSKRFIRKDVLEKVRTLSAFDYLRNYAPDLLVKNGRTDYYHQDHDSLHFSNGKWYWWSQGKGGTSALDRLHRYFIPSQMPVISCNDYAVFTAKSIKDKEKRTIEILETLADNMTEFLIESSKANRAGQR